MVCGRLVAAGRELRDGELAGDWIDNQGGHADFWERWQAAGGHWLREQALPLEILTTEYDEHPRGRIVFERPSNTFLLYANRRLQMPSHLDIIKQAFDLAPFKVRVKGDLHYR